VGKMIEIIVVGAQWGDEGKGKVIDFLSKDADIIVRFNGGGNAGHTIIYDEKEIKLHYIPSGILYGKLCILGNGMVINPEELLKEINTLKEKCTINIAISRKAQVVFPYHIKIDQERGKLIGTTGKGVGPAYADKMLRQNLRIEDIIKEDAEKRIKENIDKKRRELVLEDIVKEEEFEQFKDEIAKRYAEYGKEIAKYICDTESLINTRLKEQGTILFEGAQGVMLDIDFGTYPFVTSSNTIAQGAFVGTGANPFYLKKIIGISKTYTTRVGGGPFPTEIEGEQGDLIRKTGNEFGATTGRPRRVGYLDLFALKYAVEVSSIAEIALTKIDILSCLKEVKVGIGYRINGKMANYYPSSAEELERATPEYKTMEQIENLSRQEWFNLIGKQKDKLPNGIRSYIKFIEEYSGIPVTLLSFGPHRDDTIAYG
jgi:adenylosuccinate synthase